MWYSHARYELSQSRVSRRNLRVGLECDDLIERDCLPNLRDLLYCGFGFTNVLGDLQALPPLIIEVISIFIIL